MVQVLARAPGRVNLIGDHTDHTGGLVLPLAIDRWTTVSGTAGGTRLRLHSAQAEGRVDVALPVHDPRTVQPAWGRYAAAVAHVLHAATGLDAAVTTDLPVGAGLSSSAALEVAVALALGASAHDDASRLATALACQRAEHLATGVPCGIMDQLTSLAGRADHALLIDCDELSVTPVPLPPDVDVVVRFVAARTLAGSEYATRVAECRAAEQVIGPLREAAPGDWHRIHDPVTRARARHVITENHRVHSMVEALGAGDLTRAGQLLVEGHASLRDNFGCSTRDMDDAVERWCARDGVFGARMTGGGFGGCVVALAAPGALTDGWVVRAVDGATARWSEGS